MTNSDALKTAGQSPSVLDYGPAAVVRMLTLTDGEQTGHLAVPCSRWGRNGLDCARVTAVCLYCYGEDSGEVVTHETAEYFMGMAVNDADDIERCLTDGAYVLGKIDGRKVCETARAETDAPSVIVDGSMLCPSYRALPGAAFLWSMDWHREDRTGELMEAYSEGLDSVIDAYTDESDRFLYWEDGCLFLNVPTD